MQSLKKMNLEENVQYFTMKYTQSSQLIWIFMHLQSKWEVEMQLWSEPYLQDSKFTWLF